MHHLSINTFYYDKLTRTPLKSRRRKRVCKMIKRRKRKKMNMKQKKKWKNKNKKKSCKQNFSKFKKNFNNQEL